MSRFSAAARIAIAGVAAVVASTAATGVAAAKSAKSSERVTLRLGYFPNVTHASAIVGVEAGIFAKKLGPNVDLKLFTFNAGPEAIQAIQADALDATYVGPNPTITAWTQLAKGVRVVSGATSGGAFFVVKPSIASAADLKGKAIADPQLGGTQDVALRNWLKSKGLKTDTTGGGDVSIRPQDNATTLDAFKRGDVVGAWVPEPWATRLVNEGGGKILVDESTLWPGGKYVTTQLIVTAKFLAAHPDVVKKLVAGQVAANDYIHTNAAQAQTLVGRGIQRITGKALAASLISASFQSLVFTNDPIASSLVKDNKAQAAFGFPAATSLKGLYDLSYLNQVLKASKQSEILAKT